ncbi:hypothetical protein OG565_04975 [Streptomyces sp. NBC_00138]|nr:hypothetical protein [Streptomyces sp. NBC_00223]
MSEPYDHPAPTDPDAPADDHTPTGETGEAGGTTAGGPLGVTVSPTGNADVDAAVVRLTDADALPTEAHIEVYEDVHAGLRDALTALDENRG